MRRIVLDDSVCDTDPVPAKIGNGESRTHRGRRDESEACRRRRRRSKGARLAVIEKPGVAPLTGSALCEKVGDRLQPASGIYKRLLTGPDARASSVRR